ncbi:hypothetical protein M514_12193 [Trichuris suis]|uniref:Uncharacterized protein n=1 Tax=Trichuris suis TaxID=68888 RepID=A0A085MYB9_9BILA|nr:hypothetical protein M514_12193 [Trichuris suis]
MMFLNHDATSPANRVLGCVRLTEVMTTTVTSYKLNAAISTDWQHRSRTLLHKIVQICDYGCSDSEDAKAQRRCLPLQAEPKQYEQALTEDISHCLVAKKCLYAAEVEEAKMYTALCNPQTVDSFVILESAAESLRTRLQGTGSLAQLCIVITSCVVRKQASEYLRVERKDVPAWERQVGQPDYLSKFGSQRRRQLLRGRAEILTVEMKKPSKKTKVNNIAVYRLEAEFSSMPLHYIVDIIGCSESTFPWFAFLRQATSERWSVTIRFRGSWILQVEFSDGACPAEGKSASVYRRAFLLSQRIRLNGTKEPYLPKPDCLQARHDKMDFQGFICLLFTDRVKHTKRTAAAFLANFCSRHKKMTDQRNRTEIYPDKRCHMETLVS